MMRRRACLLGLVGAFLAAAIPVHALATEGFGNEALSDANYKDWPGIMPVINHSSRVYSVWVNGNENFYYTGDTDALNVALKSLAAASDLKPEVIIRPGPATVSSFRGDRKFAYDWQLQLIGGIAKHLTTLEKGDMVWTTRPVLTIRTGGTINLEKLVVPKPLKVTPLDTVKKRIIQGMESKDQTVRGWAAGVLTELDPYDTRSIEVLKGLLKDPIPWVRLNAAGSLPLFGKRAAVALPFLRENLKSEDAQLKAAAQKAIAKIEEAPERGDEEKSHREQAAKINLFIARVGRA